MALRKTNSLIAQASFVDLGREVISQFPKFVEFANALNDLQRQINNISSPALKPSAIAVVNMYSSQSASSSSETSNNPHVYTGSAATSQMISEGAAVFMDMNHKVYLAGAIDFATEPNPRPCHGICWKVRNVNGATLIDFVTQGHCKAQLTNMSGSGGLLRLSITPGKLTNNYNESASSILYQEVALFDSWVVDAGGTSSTTYANVSLSPRAHQSLSASA